MDSPSIQSDREMVHDRAALSQRQHTPVVEPPNGEPLMVRCDRLSCLGEECGQRHRPKLPQGGLP